MTQDEIDQQLRDSAAAKGVAYDQSDSDDVARRGNTQDALDMANRKYDMRASNTPNQDEHAPDTPTQAWTANAQTQGRSDDLYSQLKMRIDRANGPVDPNDPIIKGQSDAFNAQQTRASRDYLSNIAEKSGSLANIRGEQRMASEKLGQNTSSFLAQLLAREQGARRDEASQALGLEGSQLTADQNRDLSGQLGFGDLALRDKLGSGQLALGNRGLDVNNDQFLRQLAQRQWEDQDSSDYNWAQL